MATLSETAIDSLKEASLGDVLYVPGQPSYEERIDSYWSLSSKLRPWAIVQPRTTEEVSRVVKALVKTAGCKFAIRSGGHMYWPGASNIESGVTIDLGLLAATTYDPDTKIASLRPGARWTSVYAELEKHGVLVAGGREGLVGVGGLLTGGGKTFYTCRYGFGCDQVVNYEVVLGDGSIVEANSQTNPDLFRVLKGGSNNFGIVTRFDMNTFAATNIWDANITYTKAETDAVIEAFVNFAKNLNKAPDSHILVQWLFMPQSKDHIIDTFLTSLDGVENAPSLDRFMNIPGQKNVKMTTVAKKLVEFLVPSGKQDTWFTLTYKLDARIIKKTADVFEGLMERLKPVIPGGNFHSSMVLQPLLKSYAAHSTARGGNMFGLERLPEDCILLVIAVEVETAELLAKFAFPMMKAAMDDIESYAASLDGNVEFRYLNYCNENQDPFRSYGKENVEKMREAAAKYDPDRVFQERVPGGFKISKTRED